MEALPQNILDIINLTAQETAAAIFDARLHMPERDYFKATEKLLYSYPTLKRLVSDKEAYTRVEWQDRSGVRRFNPNAVWKSREERIEEMERDKETEYELTAKEFRYLDRVIRAFEKDEKFIAVRMYYFGENADGSPRPLDAPRWTWETIEEELGRAKKTLVRHKNEIITDMSICLFGIDAALHAATIRKVNE